LESEALECSVTGFAVLRVPVVGGKAVSVLLSWVIVEVAGIGLIVEARWRRPNP